MNKLKCHCKKKAIMVCVKHRKLLCKEDAKTHKCKLRDLTSYKNEILNLYKKDLSDLQIFKKDKTQKFFEMKKINEDVIQEQKEKINLIFDLIEKMIELNKTKKTTFFKNSLNYDYERIEQLYKNYESKGLIFEMEDEIKKKEVLKIKVDFKKKAEEVKLILKTDKLTQSLNTIFDDILKKSKKIVEFIQGSGFKTKKDIVECSTDISELFFTKFAKQKNQKKNKSSKLFNIDETELIDNFGVRNNNLNSNVFKSNVISQSSDNNSEQFDLGSSIEDTEMNYPLQKKGTMLIAHNTLKNGKKDKNIKTLIEEKIENSNKSGFSDMDMSDMSFDPDDIELEDDDDSEIHDYEEDFSINKQRFCKLLDQVLYDVNCVNFFNKNERNKINDYFESFKNILGQIIGDLKSNFSKM